MNKFFQLLTKILKILIFLIPSSPVRGLNNSVLSPITTVPSFHYYKGLRGIYQSQLFGTQKHLCAPECTLLIHLSPKNTDNLQVHISFNLHFLW